MDRAGPWKSLDARGALRRLCATMNLRFPVPLSLSLLVLLAGACGVDSSEVGSGGDEGGPAASPRSERTAEARAALTAGAGSVGDCNGNPARCAAVSLTAGVEHTVALKWDGTVWGWGWNFYGELGDNTTTDRLTPVQVSGLSSVTTVIAGSQHTVALKSDGTVWGWGVNFDGQLGDGTTIKRLTPMQMSAPSGLTAVAAGNQHTVTLKSDGTVWATGNNSNGQLGDGTIIKRLTPVQVSGLGGITAIAAGAYHTVALKSDGTVWTWGWNGEGQLGVLMLPQTLTPVQVSGLGGVTAIASGAYHTIALKSDGTVWTWGRNLEGQLGDNTTTKRYTPVQVIGLSGVTAVAGGTTGHNSMALKSDGTVWTWGSNGEGQLGDGTNTNRLTPVQVSGLSGVIAVAAGALHAVALESDGTVWTWGKNYHGELGDNTTKSRNTPGQVVGFDLVPGCAVGVAVCNAGTGACVASPVANGAACNDFNACLQNGICQAGNCTGTSTVTCAVLDQCHDAGTCNSATGLCSTPPKATGTACDDGNACTQTDTCQSGTCTGANVVVCPPVGECQVGFCKMATGVCSSIDKPDNTPCTGGLCLAGKCLIEGATSSASGSGGMMATSTSTAATTGATGSGGMMATSTSTAATTGATGSGGMMAASTSTAATTGATTGTSTGTGGSAGEDPSSDGGCACGVGRGSTNGAPWIGLGLLLTLRRRRQRAQVG
jgi:MYXO-CTERM domain-containing protein